MEGEKIKRGLECIDCATCPYGAEGGCMWSDDFAIAYIRQLEAELETVKLQRDMAVERYNRMRETAAILSDAVTELERELENDGR